MAGNQGTLLIAATEEALLWAAQRYPGIDVFCGVYPTDPRAFHALSFCPAGTPGVRYSQVVALDLPFHPACTARLDRRFSSSWLKDLPDIPALREFYRAARAYARAGGSANGDEHLAQILAQSCSSTHVAAFAAVLLLRELGLIRLDAARRLTVARRYEGRYGISPTVYAHARSGFLRDGGGLNGWHGRRYLSSSR